MEAARHIFVTEFGDGHDLMPHASKLAEVLNEPFRASAVLRSALVSAHAQLSRSRVADCAALIGDTELTFEAMRAAFIQSRGLMMIELWHPIHSRLRPDPRFKQMLIDLGLAGYWRHTGDWGEFARPLGETDFEVIA
jgi:hypothetical protein